MGGDAVPEAPQGGVLLYYLYQAIRCQDEEKRWYEDLCTQLSLVGRVRIALDGINATVGGTMEALRLHVAAVTERYSGGDKIDFKLAASRGRKSAEWRLQSGFTTLKVHLCKEVVSTGVDRLAAGDEAQPDGARHVTPAEFHAMLAEAPAAGVDTVLLDCRNLYETRVGHFEAEGATLLDPGTRTFSDLPAWLEAHQGRLAGKRMLMYCTGGVRCETASAYLRSLGGCFRGDAVVQLQGGIERYLEVFPTGGFFAGKNFVFDERVDVAPAEAVECSPVGRCLQCSAAWDDYAARQRCSGCRMLVLLCDACCSGRQKPSAGQAEQAEAALVVPLLCEICRQRRRQQRQQQQQQTAGNGEGGSRSDAQRPLRILCLHGFRQTRRNFEGRTAALRKRLRGAAEFVFVDGPHALPLLPHREEAAVDAGSEKRSAAMHQARPRRAWLVTPEQHAVLQNAGSSGAACELVLDSEQHLRQTEGWEESMAVLQQIMAEQGPFDGVMGFSQGAAVAAVLCALQSELPPWQPRWFTFAILCSAYPSAFPGHQALLQRAREAGGLPLASLHIYSRDGDDRQVGAIESEEVAESFDPQGRCFIRHGSGHLLPSTKAAAQRVRDFLAGVPV